MDFYSKAMDRAYRNLGGEDVSAHEDSVVLKVGMRGEAVMALQKNLRSLGYHLTVDGDFGPATKVEVARFQASNGLVADGVAGPVTLGRVEALMGRDVVGHL